MFLGDHWIPNWRLWPRRRGGQRGQWLYFTFDFRHSRRKIHRGDVCCPTFPRYLPRGRRPRAQTQENWVTRRAILRKPIDHIGYGDLPQARLPEFIDYVEVSATEFRELYENIKAPRRTA